MKYLLDLDHTLLDTEKLKVAAANGGYLDLVGNPDFWQHFNTVDFLFPDVLSWLKSKPKESLHLLTAFKPSQGPQAQAFQEAKCGSGGFAECFSSITVMEGMKGIKAVEIAKQFPPLEPTIFIDDRFDQCLSVKEHLPQAHCFIMVRYNVCPPIEDTRIVPVFSLEEVDVIMNQLCES